MLKIQKSVRWLRDQNFIFDSSASMAFHFSLSLSSFIVLLIAFLGKWQFFVKSYLMDFLEETFTKIDFAHFNSFLERISHSRFSGWTGVLTLLFLFFTYISFVSHTRRTFDKVITQSKHNRLRPSGVLKASFLKHLILAGSILILMVSTIMSSYGLAFLFSYYDLEITPIKWITSFFIKFIFFFSMGFILPTIRLSKKESLLFGLWAASLYTVGILILKYYFIYLANSSAVEISSSLMVILTWFYYSALISLLSLKLSLKIS